LCKKIAKKQQFYVIGTPVSHSLSPVIHLQVMSRYLCAPFYDIENVEKDELTDFVQRVRDEGASGFNITMPHKAAIIPLLDEVSGEAMALNSVNTVVNVNGRLKGFSTDGEGFYKALCEKTDPSGKNIVMLGAGGAANAVLLFLASKNVGKVTVLARKPETAMTLAQKANAFCKKDICGFDEMTKENLCKYASSADIFINATSLGMQGVEADFESLDFVKKLPKTALVCDLIYKPEFTNLLKTATQNGNETMGGIKMLINQALIADGFYLGENALINSKTETLQMAIKGALKIT
ncbi:MAG: shikimate dehydrogenase, partial [Oscillospiraceae bacterium]